MLSSANCEDRITTLNFTNSEKMQYWYLSSFSSTGNGDIGHQNGDVKQENGEGDGAMALKRSATGDVEMTDQSGGGCSCI